MKTPQVRHLSLPSYYTDSKCQWHQTSHTTRKGKHNYFSIYENSCKNMTSSSLSVFLSFLCCIYGLLNSRRQHCMELLWFLVFFGFMGKSAVQSDVICFKLQIALSAFYERTQELQTVVVMFWRFWVFKFHLHFNLVTEIIIFPPNEVLTIDLTSKLFKRKDLGQSVPVCRIHTANVLFRQQDCRFEQWTLWLN